MEGIDSLDMRPLEEQAKDPLKRAVKAEPFDFKSYIPFRRDPNYRRHDDPDGAATPSSEEAAPAVR